MKTNPWAFLSLACGLQTQAIERTCTRRSWPTFRKEGQDHPLLSRFPGSVIYAYQQNVFDEYGLILGKVVGMEVEKVKELEGKVTKIVYDVPEGRSTLEVYRNYEAALTGAGFTMLWQAKGAEELGSWGDLRKFFGGMHYNHTNQRYLAAHLKRPEEGDVYMAFYLNLDLSMRRSISVVKA